MSVESIEIARQRIKENIAAHERGEESALKLDLSGLEIEDIEKDIPELRKCVWLQELNLTNNQISEIKNIEPLTSLQYLHLGYNQISEIKNIETLTSLQYLYLGYNQISEIKNIETLTNLKELSLNDNQISEIKNIENLTNLQELSLNNNEISEIKNIQSLTNLQKLDLTTNNIREIKNIEALTNLQKLDLGGNPIREIKNMDSLTNLQSIDLSSSLISEIKNIESLTNLQQLNLGNNRIKEIKNIDSLINLQQLDLGNNRIREIKNINSLINLQKLYLDSNQISKIKNMDSLINLQQLYLDSNQISKIKNMDSLINLQQLNLNFNQISEIENIEPLTKLQEIYLECNQISKIENIPPLINLQKLDLNFNQISEIKNIESLTNLQRLYLSSNKISEIKNIESLTNLQRLYLSSNKISEIKNIGSLTNLQHIDLSSNKISEIKNIESLTNLQHIDLRKNKISEIKNIESLTNLQHIDLRDNKIISLHLQIPYLKNSLLEFTLTNTWESSGINIYGNPIANPPIEIVKQGKDAIIRYFEELETSGSEKLYGAKVLVLGEGGAGKTTLIRKLTQGIEAAMPTEEERTKGIDITQLPFVQEGNKHTAHLWDFGGQEIYHATHQFFLTHRSVYVLVTDSRKDDTDFHYWLQVIELLGGKSPIVVIGNRKDDAYKQLPEGELRGRYSNIKAFHYLNLKNDGENLAKLLKAVQYEVSSLPQMGEEVPKPMVQVRDRLNVLQEEGRKYIGLHEFYAICKAEGLEQDRADYYSQLLHDLGLLLHFQKDVVLKHTVFLDNEWITDAVYAVLDDEIIKVKQKGCFSESDAKGLWQASYAPMWQELLALMGKFELCYELPNKKGHYIAPQLLDVERTAAAAAWQLSDSLQLRYQYEFMPKGMVSRLIVRLHRYIADVQESAWKTGAILKDKATGAELLMYEVYGKKEIYLSAKGVFAKDLLAVVSAEVDELNGTYENIKVKKLVPCVCRECKHSAEPHFYDYKNLIERKQKGIKTSECQKSFVGVQVEELLDAVKGSEVKSSDKKSISDIQRLVAEAKLDKALLHLLELAEYPDTRNLIIGMQGRLAVLEQKELSSIISNDDANLERNKITVALLAIIKDL